MLVNAVHFAGTNLDFIVNSPTAVCATHNAYVAQVTRARKKEYWVKRK